MYQFVDQPTNLLSRGSQLVLWAMRGWTRQLNNGRCPPAALAPAFHKLGIISALPPFHKMMVLLKHHAARDFAFRCLAAPAIGVDEAVLLGVWQDVATGQVANAEATLAMIADEEAAKVIIQSMHVASNVFSTKDARPDGLAVDTYLPLSTICPHPNSGSYPVTKGQ